MKSYFFITIFITILWPAPFPCIHENQITATRQKREPPIYRQIKQSYRSPSRRKPKPLYGTPPRHCYGPPKSKSVYGPSPIKPIYGPPQISLHGPPPKPVYGPPPKTVHAALHESLYGPPPKPVYGPPSKPLHGPPLKLIYNRLPKPIYGTPSFMQYDELEHSSNSHNSHDGASSHLHEEHPPSPSFHYQSNKENYETLNHHNISPDIYGPPSTSYGIPSETYKPPSSENYEQTHYKAPSLSYGPPTQQQQQQQQQYNPPSTNYGVPHYEQQTTSYSHPFPQYDSSYQSYEIPTTHESPPLTYDSSSASYGTPGAINSYGVPINQQQNAHYSQPEPTINIASNLEDYYEYSNPFSAQSSISHQYVHLEKAKEFSNSSIKSKKHSVLLDEANTRPSNHNYDGPGIEDDFAEIYVRNKRKKNENVNNLYPIKKSEESQGKIEILKSHSFNYYAGKSNSLTDNNVSM